MTEQIDIDLAYYFARTEDAASEPEANITYCKYCGTHFDEAGTEIIGALPDEYNVTDVKCPYCIASDELEGTT